MNPPMPLLSHPPAAPHCPQCGYALPSGEAESLCPACLISAVLERGDMEEDGDAEEAPPAPLTCGGYELLEVIGRGGMGVVYRARKPGLGREVALKMIAAAELAEPDEVRRFRQEADVIAQLSHPNIITVHDTGEDAGRAWFVMQLARGGTLAQRLVAKPDAFTAQESAQLVARLARAVACAHGRGVLHRDLKPANILLDAGDTPLVSDFGLARLAHGPGGVTLTGAALGTPAWMAPEQAAGAQAATTASDVYGLGAILYHLLAGRAPFEGTAPLEVLHKVLTTDPPPLRPAGVPRDLATVCLMALAKDPAKRYRSAAELADDLERWLAGEPVRARPAAWPERAWKWSRRHPALAALLAAAALGAAVLSVVLVKGNDLLRAERNVALAQASRASASEQAMALNVYAADLFLARRAFEDGHLGAARATLERHLPAPGGPDLRGFEWHALHRQCQGDDARTLATHTAAVPAVAFSPDGRTALTGGRDGALRFWNTDDGTLQRALPLKPDTPPLADFAVLAALPVRSPEVAQVLAGGTSFEGLRMRARPSRLGEINTVAWSPDGKWIVTGGNGAYVRLWRAEDGALHGFIPSMQVTQVAFTHDSAEIVLAIPVQNGSAPEVRRYAVGTLARLETIRTPQPAFGLAANVAGLAIAGDGEVIMRSVDGRAAVRWPVDHPVRSLAVSPDGARVAVFGDENGTLRRSTGEVIAGLSPQQGRVRSPVFSSDGRLLAAGCEGQVVTVYNGETGKPLHSLRGHTGEVLGVAFRPGTSQILSGSGDFTARFWPEGTARSTDTGIIPHREALAAVSADGTHLLGESIDGRVFLTTTGGPAVSLPDDHPRYALALTGSGDALRILTRRRSETVLEWWQPNGTPDGTPIAIPNVPKKLRGLTVSSDSRILAVSDARKVTLHDTRTGRVIRTLPDAPLTIESLRLSADGTLLIAREYPRVAAVADTATGQWLWHERLTSGTLGPMIFSPDQSLLVTGADDAIVSIRRARTGEVVTTLREHLSEITTLAFTPDGRTLASASKDRTLRLWHVPTWRPLGPLRREVLIGSLHFAGSELLAAEHDRRWLRLSGEQVSAR